MQSTSERPVLALSAPRSDRGWLSRGADRLALGGLGLFVAIGLLVQLRVLAGIDLATMLAKQWLLTPELDALGSASAILLSAEFTVSYGCLGAFYLWRRGLGWLALAPLAFVLLVPIEVLLKVVLHQPFVMDEFQRDIHYPLLTLELDGTFPSGHAIRSGFFGAFVAVLLLRRGGAAGRLGAAVAGLVALVFGLTRVYLGFHWLSDVMAGLTLGASGAVFVASRLAEALWPRDRHSKDELAVASPPMEPAEPAGTGEVVVIRPLEPADAPTLIAWGGGTPYVEGVLRASIAEHLAGRRVILLAVADVATAGPEIVGAVELAFMHVDTDLADGWRSAYLLGLEVDRRRRRTGIATRLVTTVEEIARGRGLRRLTLMVEPGNDAALRLYAKLGYAELKRSSFSWRGQVLPAICLEKTLGAE